MIEYFPVLVMVTIAQAEVLGPWATALINYGALGLWVIFLVYKDKKEGEKRDIQHAENQISQKKIEEAFRATMVSLMVAVEGMKNMDSAFTELAKKVKHDNENPHL